MNEKGEPKKKEEYVPKNKETLEILNILKKREFKEITIHNMGWESDHASLLE